MTYFTYASMHIITYTHITSKGRNFVHIFYFCQFKVELPQKILKYLPVCLGIDNAIFQSTSVGTTTKSASRKQYYHKDSPSDMWKPCDLRESST